MLLNIRIYLVYIQYNNLDNINILYIRWYHKVHTHMFLNFHTFLMDIFTYIDFSIYKNNNHMYYSRVLSIQLLYILNMLLENRNKYSKDLNMLCIYYHLNLKNINVYKYHMLCYQNMFHRYLNNLNNNLCQDTQNQGKIGNYKMEFYKLNYYYILNISFHHIIHKSLHTYLHKKHSPHLCFYRILFDKNNIFLLIKLIN